MDRDPRILVCAPSNAAVDELAKRISLFKIENKKSETLRVIRVGILSNIDDNLRDLTLDFIIDNEVENKKKILNIENLEVSNSERMRRKF